MAFVSSANTSGASPLSVTGVNMTGADTLVIVALAVSASSKPPAGEVGASDNSGNNYLTLFEKATGADGWIGCYFTPNATVSASMTGTITWVTVVGLTIVFMGFSGRATAPVDTVGNTTDAAATSHSMSILYPSVTGCDAIAMAVQTATTTNTTYTAGGSWTNRLPATYAAICQTRDNIATASIQNTFTTVASDAFADFMLLLAPDGYIGRQARGLSSQFGGR